MSNRGRLHTEDQVIRVIYISVLKQFCSRTLVHLEQLNRRRENKDNSILKFLFAFVIFPSMVELSTLPPMGFALP